MSTDNIVRLRGLPWAATEDDVKQFLDGCSILTVVLTVTKEGRATGEAFVELHDSQHLDHALGYHKQNMQNRYIEVLKARRDEMSFALTRTSNIRQQNDCRNFVVRLRGLPFGCTADDIRTFFTGFTIPSDGIVRPTDHTGRVTGEAFVKFLDKETTERSLQKHKQEIGNRYIEVFRSTDEECYRAQYPYGGGPNDDLLNRTPKLGASGLPSLLDWVDDPPLPPPAARKRERSPIESRRPTRFVPTGMIGGATGHLVHMRGLPFRCTATEVVDFFRPLKVLNVLMVFDQNTGRPMGEADVEFLIHEDAVEAMKKDKQHIGGRYVDLFLESHAAQPQPWQTEAVMPGNGYDSYGGNGTGYDQAAMSFATAGHYQPDIKPATHEYTSAPIVPAAADNGMGQVGFVGPYF